MKLEPITRTQAQGARTISPQQAAAPHLAKASFLGKVSQMALNVNELAEDIQVNNANADYMADISKFKQDYAQRVEPWTQEELDLMGIGDQIDASEGPVPAWKAYPYALQQRMEDAREKMGEGVRSKAKRNAWMQDTITSSQSELERAVQDSANMAIESMANEANERMENSLLEGDFEGARNAIETNPIYSMNPKAKGVKRKLLNDINLKEAMSEVSLALMSRDEDQIDSVISKLASPDYDGPINSTQRKQLVFSAINSMKAMDAEDEAQEKVAQDFHTREAMTRVRQGEWTQADIIRTRDNYSLEKYNMLLNQTDPDTKANFKTDNMMATEFDLRMQTIKSGNFDGDFIEAVDEMERWLETNTIVTDIVTGEKVQKISRADLNTWGDDIDALRVSPFVRDTGRSYKNLVNDLSLRIRGGASDAIGYNDEDTAALYAEALGSLESYINDNGGAKADLMKWRKEKMPEFLTAVAKKSFLKLPKDIQGLVQVVDGKLDVTTAIEKQKLGLSKIMNIDEDDRTSTQKVTLQNHRKRIVALERWAIAQRGSDYVR